MLLSKNHFLSLLSLTLLLQVLQADARAQINNEEFGGTRTKLFVFGDSYADTGNTIRSGLSSSSEWNQPYGITYPGKPAGRASDGRVLTDYIAKYLGVKSPVVYELRKLNQQDMKYYGVNFAYGGTGVFVTFKGRPDMTTQIDYMEQLIKQDNLYSATDLTYSVALVSVSGNDYGSDLPFKNASTQGPLSYPAKVVNQITTNLRRINGLGVKKIGVTNLGPLGCIPLITAPFLFQHCNDIFNPLLALHNSLLNQAVAKLNQEATDNSTFVVLDLNESFKSILSKPLTYNFNQNPLVPCCLGATIGYNCGDVDANKVKQYRVCDDPKSAFFWDLAHPTDAGWNAVYNNLRTTNSFQTLLHF